MICPAGQRYTVVVKATPKNPSSNQKYWLRTRIAQGCGTVEQDDEETGMITYNKTSPTSVLPTTVPNDGRIACEDEPVASLKPILQWNVTNRTLDNAPELTNYSFAADITEAKFHGFMRWALTDTPLFINYSNPSLLNISGTNADPNYAAVDCKSFSLFARLCYLR